MACQCYILFPLYLFFLLPLLLSMCFSSLFLSPLSLSFFLSTPVFHFHPHILSYLFRFSFSSFIFSSFHRIFVLFPLFPLLFLFLFFSLFILLFCSMCLPFLSLLFLVFTVLSIIANTTTYWADQTILSQLLTVSCVLKSVFFFNSI